MSAPDPHELRPPTLAESVGQVLSAAACALFGHVTDEAVPFCLWCSADLEPEGPRATAG